LLVIKQANVTLMVKDMRKALNFYTSTLGLKIKAQYGDEFAQLEAPGTIIALHPAVKGGPKPGDAQGLSIGFAVDDIEKTAAELTQKGVRLSKISDDGPVRLAHFKDADGYPLYLSQSKWG